MKKRVLAILFSLAICNLGSLLLATSALLVVGHTGFPQQLGRDSYDLVSWILVIAPALVPLSLCVAGGYVISKLSSAGLVRRLVETRLASGGLII